MADLEAKQNGRDAIGSGILGNQFVLNIMDRLIIHSSTVFL
jgi:hypothetical protein